MTAREVLEILKTLPDEALDLPACSEGCDCDGPTVAVKVFHPMKDREAHVLFSRDREPYEKAEVYYP